MSALLQVRDLRVTFRTGWRKPDVTAVDGVSFKVNEGETVALVGESGSGKTTIGRAVLGLEPSATGDVRVRGKKVLGLTRPQRRVLARELQVVFQDPVGSLNPALTVGRILTEPVRVQRDLPPAQARAVVTDLLERVALPADAADRYPSAFSGGQRQRIAIARAFATDPDLVICDEPTSALDVSTQARVLDLLAGLQREARLGYLFITHDLAVVRTFADRVIVLRRGRIVEEGPVDRVCDDPQDAYTRTLLDAAPVPDPVLQAQRRERRLQAKAAAR